eukprot:gene34784-44988_t
MNLAYSAKDKYHFMCKFSIGEAQQSYQCRVALFSLSSFDVQGKVGFRDWTKDFCQVDNEGCLFDENSSSIAVALRGNCTFDVKASTAYKMGHKALVVINSEAKGEEVFPMGSSDPEYSAQIPIVMISYSSWQHLYSVSENSGQEMTAHLSIDISRQDNRAIPGLLHEHILNKPQGVKKSKLFLKFVANSIAGSCGLILAVLTIAWLVVNCEIVLNGQSIIVPSTQSGGGGGGDNQIGYVTVALVCLIGAIVVFPLALYVRLGTLRELLLTPAEVSADSHYLGGRSSLFGTYNHRETDEVIFETLVYSVGKRWNDYSLRGKPIIDSLRLAKENYNDALFIHPPFFVYTSAFLYYYLSIPLPVVPLIFHFATAAMIPIILSCILRNSFEISKQDTHLNLNLRMCYSAMAIKAMIVFLCCPIAAFCSQKFWIDNALLMTTTLAATVHMLLCGANLDSVSGDKVRAASVSKSVGYQILSGFVFGFIALNTKITALALLPFMLCWTAFHRVEVFLYSDRRTSLSMSADIIAHVGAFVASTAAAYSPWGYIYWSYTGRLSPNAWPSKEMLDNSPFVRAAIHKPYHTYFSTLLTFSPMHLFGLLFCSLTIVVMIFAVAVTCFRPISVDDDDDDDSEPPKEADSGRRRNYIGDVLRRNAVMVKLCVFSLWPLSFLVGLTLLGVMGAGFQSRFLLPLLPATAILAVLHSCVYGMMFAPLFGDLDLNIVGMMDSMYENPLKSPSSEETWQQILQYLRHFGLER